MDPLDYEPTYFGLERDVVWYPVALTFWTLALASAGSVAGLLLRLLKALFF